jgi:hypothetical protein
MNMETRVRCIWMLNSNLDQTISMLPRHIMHAPFEENNDCHICKIIIRCLGAK